MSPPPAPPKRLGRPSRKDMLSRPDAATRLLHAATAEFVEHGFDGTSTNRIAERAGFAPQTFYRWYDDKLAIFIAVHNAWAEAELAQLEAMMSERAPSAHLAEAMIENHRSFLVFMRSLQRLAHDTPVLRQARAQARRARMARVQLHRPGLCDEQIAALLIGMDHLCEALAEGEFADLGLSGHEACAQLANLIDQIRSA